MSVPGRGKTAAVTPSPSPSPKILTKADLLRSGNTPVEVEVEGVGPLLLRTLTDGEYQTAQSMMVRALTATADMDTVMKQVEENKKAGKTATMDGLSMKFDLATYTEAEYESQVYVAACALSVKERWTMDEVKKLRPVGSAAKIAAKAYEISGVDGGGAADELVKSFRPV